MITMFIIIFFSTVYLLGWLAIIILKGIVGAVGNLFKFNKHNEATVDDDIIEIQAKDSGEWGEIIMEGVYTVAILVFIIVWCIINHAVCMSGYTTKEKNPNDYMEINRKQREKDIAQVKAQDKYDNDWGYIR